MRTLLILVTIALLSACGERNTSTDDNLMSKFNSTWQIYETFTRNSDGSITYNGLPWGGLVGEVQERNMPVDWSMYESITFEFAEPTKVPTQIVISEKLKTWGKAGISSLTCYFDGQDVSSVEQVVLQVSDTCDVTISNVYLTPNDGNWESTPLWNGNCAFGDWADGFVIAADKFNSAYEGNKLEFILTTDKSDPDASYWLFKTVYDKTYVTLEGNASELNEWGCVTLGKESTDYRIVLTAGDIKQLREHGLFVNGYRAIVTQCNLLRKTY